MYTSVRSEREGYGWSTDYPAADQNFMIRLSELTSTKVDFDARGNPNHRAVEITDPALFTCPFVMTSDVGTSDSAATRWSGCASICSRAASCGWTTSGAPPPELG